MPTLSVPLFWPEADVRTGSLEKFPVFSPSDQKQTSHVPFSGLTKKSDQRPPCWRSNEHITSVAKAGTSWRDNISKG